MLFNSASFIFLFMPLLVVAFALASRLTGPTPRVVVMALFSVAFYAVWDWRFVPLLLGSIAMNFLAGHAISHRDGDKQRSLALILAVVANVGVLFAFKYLDFALEGVERLFTLQLPAPHLILPLGISFFTFTQIAYLVDVYQRRTLEHSATNYTLFVTFFPHLIAGPILHHKEMIPQFETMSL